MFGIEKNRMMHIQQHTQMMPAPGGAAADPQEPYITKKELADRLRKSARTVEKWQKQGVIPFYKLGRSVFYRWSEVQAHLGEHFRVCRLR
jgi:excisionase family DNA binding protein